MVESFHLQLKASPQPSSEPSWSVNAPLALLGVRSSVKMELHCDASELVFGTTLCLPGQLVVSPPESAIRQPDFPYLLAQRMWQLHSQPPPDSSCQKVHVPPQLSTSIHVFLCNDAVCRLRAKTITSAKTATEPLSNAENTHPSPPLSNAVQ